MSRVLSKFGS